MSADYGTFVLCISAVLGLVAAYLARAWDKWGEEQSEYMRRWHPTQEQIERSKR